MRTLIERLLAPKEKTPSPKLAQALRKRRIETILLGEGLSRKAAQRAMHEILDAMDKA